MSETPRSVLVLHGLGGGPYELAPLIDAIRADGLEVDAPTLPGHVVDGPIMPASTWQEWVEASGKALEDLARRAGPVAVVGFSTGGTLALELAASRAAQVDRIALICPFLAIRHYWFYGPRPETYLRSPWSRWIGHVPRRPSAIKDREGKRSLDAAVTRRFRTFHLGASRSALDLIARVKGRVADVRAPALVLQSSRDTVVQPEEACWLVDHLGSTRKELSWLERSDHLACWDHDRRELIDRVVAFLRRPIES